MVSIFRRGFFAILLMVTAGAAVFFYQEYLDSNTVVRMRPPAGYPLPQAIGAKSPSIFEKLDAIEKVSERQEAEPAPVATTTVSVPAKSNITRTPIGVTQASTPKTTPKILAKHTPKTRGGRIASRAKNAKRHSRLSRR